MLIISDFSLNDSDIETQIQCPDEAEDPNKKKDDDTMWISLGGFRRIHLLQTVHSHSTDNSNGNEQNAKCSGGSHQHANNDGDESADIITLCYPSTEINHYLNRQQLEWEDSGHGFQIRMRLRYKIAYRVAHLSEQIDSVISRFSDTVTIEVEDNDIPMKWMNALDGLVPTQCVPVNQQSIIPKLGMHSTFAMRWINQLEEQKVSDLNPEFDDNANAMPYCVSLCSDRSVVIDSLSNTDKSREYLQCTDSHKSDDGQSLKRSLYPNDWLFYPSMTIGTASNLFVESLHSDSEPLDDDDDISMLFVYDGFNNNEETVSCGYAANLNTSNTSNGSKWYKLPSVSRGRSRTSLVYAPRCRRLLLLGGYRYESKCGAKYLDSVETLDLNMNSDSESADSATWKMSKAKMRTKRCEHSVGLISNKTDKFLICGGSNDMFLRSSSILTVSSEDGMDLKLSFRRGAMMKEAVIKGTVCYDDRKDAAYLIGGNNGFGSTRNAQCFNAEKNRWKMLKGTLFEHDDYPCVWMERESNSKYYGMIGVIGHSQQLSCVEYYDSRSDQWFADCQYPWWEQDAKGKEFHHLSRLTLWNR